MTITFKATDTHPRRWIDRMPAKHQEYRKAVAEGLNKVCTYMGIKWCEDNVDTIVGWLREEAQTRRLPFSDFAGKALLMYAIRRARKAGAREGLPDDMILAP